MPLPRSPRTSFFALAAGYAAVFGARAWWQHATRTVLLRAGKPSYSHDEFVAVRLSTLDPALRERWRREPPLAVVRRSGSDVVTIAGLRRLPLKEKGFGSFEGLWPVPWNAPAGTYELALEGQDDLGARLTRTGFKIERRRPAPLPKGLSILTLETVDPLESLKITAPDGRRTDWRGLLDWAQYVGADALWMLGGETPGKKPGEVWVSANDEMIPQVAAECRRRGLKFGVYAMCYLTMSTTTVGGYEYAQEVEEGRAIPTRAISLRDPKRPRDVAARLKRWSKIPGVDYVGLDYIRNALGGYELADEFFAEMPGVTPPPEWASLTPEQRMVWFARKKIMRRDDAFIDAWQWWRAHKVGAIVRDIKRRLGGTPLWAFTLTWDKGWQHGQDPVMMNDAGVDADALMLYEADRAQYDAIIADFRRYVRRADVQLVVGEIMDWPLHQRSPDGPREFYRRAAKAEDQIYADGPAYGVFFHDASRALWGRRLGPWGSRAWLDEAKRATEHMKAVAR